MTQMPHRTTFSWMSDKLELRDVAYGKGICATEAISAGEYLAMFGGYVMTIQEEEALPEDMRDFAHQISPDHVFGIREKSQLHPVDYFNHSCDPNAGFQGQIQLVAMRDIAAGEHVTFDYAMVLSDFSGDAPYELECSCGVQICRSTIGVDDWKIPELQLRYADYFQPYLQKAISDLKQ